MAGRVEGGGGDGDEVEKDSGVFFHVAEAALLVGVGFECGFDGLGGDVIGWWGGGVGEEAGQDFGLGEFGVDVVVLVDEVGDEDVGREIFWFGVGVGNV